MAGEGLREAPVRKYARGQRGPEHSCGGRFLFPMYHRNVRDGVALLTYRRGEELRGIQAKENQMERGLPFNRWNTAALIAERDYLRNKGKSIEMEQKAALRAIIRELAIRNTPNTYCPSEQFFL
jgi:hypothetical protein